MLRYNRLNLILFIVAAGLCGILLWWQPAVQPHNDARPLAACQPDAIKRIVIAHGDHTTLTLVKTNTDWHLETPFAAPASAYRVRALLGLCQAVSQSDYPASSLDLAQLGLATPHTVVRMDEAIFRLGGGEPLQGQRYLLLDNLVYLISGILYPTEDDAASFVDPTLMTDGGAIVALSFSALPGSSAIEATQSDGHWRINPPRPDLSADWWPMLADGWRRIRAVEVRRDAMGASLGSITVTLAQVAHPLRFEVLSMNPEVVLRRADLHLRYVLPHDIAWGLLHIPAVDEVQSTSAQKVGE